MKIWHCHYDWYGRMGAFQYYDCIVVAEIKSKALGMALMRYPDTYVDDWIAYEIPTDKELVYHISSRSN